MLDELFMKILDLSKTGSIVILAVMIARLCLKKAPKIISYALWAVVLFRLLCPVSLQMPVSILPDTTPLRDTYALADVPVSVVDAGVVAYQAVEEVVKGGSGVQQIPTANVDAAGNTEYVTADWADIGILLGQYVWLCGVGVMLLHSWFAYAKLRKNMAVMVLLKENVYLADDISSPFVMGIFRPKIYLPSRLGEHEREYIIAHEQQHIRRLDPLWKALAFLALILHWFNPLVWLAFVLAEKDMEMSCDEAVIRKLGPAVRADYAASLVSLATGKRIIAGTPLAFGEGDPKGRIRNLAKWKKPAVWAVAVAILLSVTLSACLMIDPAQDGKTDPFDWQLSGNTQTNPSGTASGQPGNTGAAVMIPDGDVTRTPFVMYIAGSDYQGNGLARYSRNDANILVVVNPVTKQILLINTPRDYYIPNPAGDGALDKLSHCGVAAVENAVQAMSEFYGVPNRYYTQIGFDGLKKLVDAVDGVTVYSDTSWQAGNTWIQAGENLLNGEQAAELAREQYDLGGTDSYTLVMKVLAKKIFSGELASVYADVLKNMKGLYRTNMSSEDMAKLAKMQLSDMADWNIVSYAVTGEEAYRETYSTPGQKVYVIIPDMDTVENARALMQHVADGGIFSQSSDLVTQTQEPTTLPSAQWEGISLRTLTLTGYSKENAAKDGCVIRHSDQIEANADTWTAFLEKIQIGNPAAARFAVCNEDSVRYLYDIEFDGNAYTIKSTRELYGDEQLVYMEVSYPCLLHFSGERTGNTDAYYGSFDLYYLSMEPYTSLEEVQLALEDQTIPVPPIEVYNHTEYVRVVKYLAVSEVLEGASMELDGRLLVSVTQKAQLEEIRNLFAAAEYLGYEPKTYNLGPELTLKGTDGQTVMISVDLIHDLVMVDGEFYDYGPGYNEEGALNAIAHMLGLFGLSDWPEWMYDYYAQRDWELPPPAMMARYP